MPVVILAAGRAAAASSCAVAAQCSVDVGGQVGMGEVESGVNNSYLYAAAGVRGQGRLTVDAIQVLGNLLRCQINSAVAPNGGYARVAPQGTQDLQLGSRRHFNSHAAQGEAVDVAHAEAVGPAQFLRGQCRRSHTRPEGDQEATEDAMAWSFWRR